jgi:hypothetical protein
MLNVLFWHHIGLNAFTEMGWDTSDIDASIKYLDTVLIFCILFPNSPGSIYLYVCVYIVLYIYNWFFTEWNA